MKFSSILLFSLVLVSGAALAGGRQLLHNLPQRRRAEGHLTRSQSRFQEDARGEPMIESVGAPTHWRSLYTRCYGVHHRRREAEVAVEVAHALRVHVEQPHADVPATTRRSDPSHASAC